MAPTTFEKGIEGVIEDEQQTSRVRTILAYLQKVVDTPTKPRKAVTAYEWYVRYLRMDIKTEVPNERLSQAQIRQLAHHRWSTKNAAWKKMFSQLEAKDQERKDFEQLLSNSYSLIKFRGIKNDLLSRPGALHYKSGYILFCKEERSRIKEEIVGLRPADVMKLLGRMWQALSGEEKQNYNTRNHELKQSYNKRNHELKQQAFFSDLKIETSGLVAQQDDKPLDAPLSPRAMSCVSGASGFTDASSSTFGLGYSETDDEMIESGSVRE